MNTDDIDKAIARYMRELEAACIDDNVADQRHWATMITLAKDMRDRAERRDEAERQAVVDHIKDTFLRDFGHEDG